MPGNIPEAALTAIFGRFKAARGAALAATAGSALSAQKIRPTGFSAMSLSTGTVQGMTMV